MVRLTQGPRWYSCECCGLACSSREFTLSRSNKAVLNSSPDLPLLFLLIQLVLAVVLLHGAARITPKVEIPAIEMRTAKKLLPVTTVNVVGLVFNILCLRGVEASYFQVPRA